MSDSDLIAFVTARLDEDIFLSKEAVTGASRQCHRRPGTCQPSWQAVVVTNSGG